LEAVRLVPAKTKSVKVEDDPKCAFCEFVMKKLDSILEDNATKVCDGGGGDGGDNDDNNVGDSDVGDCDDDGDDDDGDYLAMVEVMVPWWY
jgi:hypothetical protein